MSFCGLRGSASWAWQKCNRLLKLGRPWGAVKLSRWCVSGDRGGCSARKDLKPKFYYSTQTMVTVGIFPFKENSHGRAGNRTRDFIISSQRFWPLDHETGLTTNININNLTIKINNLYCLGIMTTSLTNTVFSVPCTDWIWSMISYRMVRFVFHGYPFLPLCSVLAFYLQFRKHGEPRLV